MGGMYYVRPEILYFVENRELMKSFLMSSYIPLYPPFGAFKSIFVEPIR